MLGTKDEKLAKIRAYVQERRKDDDYYIACSLVRGEYNQTPRLENRNVRAAVLLRLRKNGVIVRPNDRLGIPIGRPQGSETRAQAAETVLRYTTGSTSSIQTGPLRSQELQVEGGQPDLVLYYLAMDSAPPLLSPYADMVQAVTWVTEDKLGDYAYLHPAEMTCAQIALHSYCKPQESEPGGKRRRRKAKADRKRKTCPRRRSNHTAPNLGRMTAYGGEGPGYQLCILVAAISFWELTQEKT